MIKNIGKRALIIALAISLIGNSLQLPGAILPVEAQEAQDAGSEEAVSGDAVVAATDTLEQLENGQSEEEQGEITENTILEGNPSLEVEADTETEEPASGNAVVVEADMEEQPENEQSEEGQEAGSEESVSGNAAAVETDGEEQQEVSTESAILHIGQIISADISSDSDGLDDRYDSPIVLTPNSQVRLFTHWSMECEYDGILTWSILRGEAGTNAGTTNLINSEDDWAGFEEVPSSPYFTIQEEENNSPDKILVITANGLEYRDGYDYYIRATFTYTGDQTGYSAITTVPVTMEIMEQKEEDAETEEEETADDVLQEEAETGEEGTADEIPQEETAETEEEETADEALQEETAENEPKGASVLTEMEEEVMEEALMEENLSDAQKNQDQPIDADGNILEISDEVWIAGFERESDSLCYTGDKITQNLRVYHEETLLDEGTDYQLAYKNNVNAAAYNSANAPSVKITMKGQYSGSRTLYFTILPRNIEKECSYETEQIVYYKKKIKVSTPEIFLGSKKLVYNKDFVCDYSTLPENYKYGDSYEEGTDYEYTVYGMGNFTGSYIVKFIVIQDKSLDFKNAVVTLNKEQYEYHGEALSESDVQIVSLKAGEETLDASLYEYKVYADSVGTGYVEVYPSDAGKNNGYLGRKRLEIEVVGDRKIKDAELGDNWKDSIIFSGKELEDNGGIIQGKTGVLVYGDNLESLVEGVDYSVEYRNNEKVGQATIIFTGMGRYMGSFKKTYNITSNTELYINWHHTDENGAPVAPYTKGGVTPQFDLIEYQGSEKEYTLKYKTDYIIKLSHNRNLGTMVCKIIGRGNYKGYEISTEVEIIPGDLGNGTILVKDRVYSGWENAWKAPVTIMDANGKKLAAGVDYNLTYDYEGIEEGVPRVDTIVNVTAVGINNYVGSSISGSYRICSKDISELTIIIDPQEYRGDEIELSKEDIHVYASKSDARNGIEITEDCYEIIGYGNNIKVGRAEVTLRGIGAYGGTKTYYFDIIKKEYEAIRATEIRLDATVLSLGLRTSRQLIATVLPEDAYNKTILWETSDSEVATVSTDGTITAKSPGTVTITAVSQDTGKKAYCNVTVVIIPVTSISLNEEKIEGVEGTQFQLEVTDIQPADATYQTIQWESSAPEIADVDENGNVSLKKAGMAVIKVYADQGRFVKKCLVFVEGQEETKPETEYLTPQMFRTVNEDDDTKAFNTAIQNINEECNTLYVPAGTYKINAETGIRLKSDMNLVMSDGAVLQAIGNSNSHYDVIYVLEVSNVSISGGQIIGERYLHGGTEGEWGMGIGIYDSTDIRVDGVAISDCWGDGIYMGSREYTQNPGCREITVTNCYLYNNRRNNMSIVWADDVVVDNCMFENANGTAPEFGIDIETNYSDNPCERITISNSTFTGNAQASMGIITAADDVHISGCTMNGAFTNYAGTNVKLTDTVINGEMNARIGVTMEGSTINDGGSEEDELVVDFSVDEGPYTLEKYGINNSNQMSGVIINDEESSSGKALSLTRLTQGTQESGYYLDLSEMTGGNRSALDAGVTYRFEYVVKGSGTWGIRSTQTGWYPICPVSDKYSTGYVTYKAKYAQNGKVLLYAVDRTKDMYMEIESIKIYEVK